MVRKLLATLLALAAAAGLLWLLRPKRVGARAVAASAEPGRTGAVESEPAAAGRCAAITRSGRRCTRDAEPGSDRCWQHGG